jgi:hypothetical protein
MKVKDFIKMLQEHDPEDYVRLDGGAILFAEPKEGYWDGPYEYINEDGNFVISIKSNKVDIHTIDVEDFIWEHGGDYSKINFEGFEQYVEKERNVQRYIEKFKKISEEYKEAVKGADGWKKSKGS